MLEIPGGNFGGTNPMNSKKKDVTKVTMASWGPPVSSAGAEERRLDSTVLPPSPPPVITSVSNPALLHGIRKQSSLNPYERGLKARVSLLMQSKQAFEVESHLGSGSRARHASLSAKHNCPNRDRVETVEHQKKLMHDSNIAAYELKQAPFNPKQLVFSFVCEILPSFTVAPLFVILCYGWTKGINVACHRALSIYCPSDDKKVRSMHAQLLRRTVWVTLLTYGAWAALLVYAMYHQELRKDGIDHVEVIIFITPIIIRALVVATKYSYFTQQELEDMSNVDTWSPIRSGEKMLLAGWCNLPRVFRNLLQREIDLATLQADVDLTRVHFRISRGASSESAIESMDISAMSVLARVVYSKFGAPMSVNVNTRLIFLAQLCVAAAPPLTRLACSRAPFGTCWASRLFLIVAFFNTFFVGAVMYLFLVSAFHDFRRRTNASKLMSALVTYPGVPLEEFLSDDGADKSNSPITGDQLRRTFEKSDGESLCKDVNVVAGGPTKKTRENGAATGISPLDGFVENVFFDIREPNNAYAWLLSRRVLRGTGEMFYDRCKLFVSFYFAITAVFLVVLNVEVWTDVEHFVFGTVQLVLYGTFIAAGFGFAAYESWNMQATVSPDRLMLKKETMMVEKEIIDVSTEISELKQSKKSPSELQDLYEYKDLLSQSVNFLRSGEGLIAYEEEICKPREILGYIADKKVVNTVFGAISSGVFLAYQGVNQNKGSYNSSGAYYYSTSADY